jgi:hypothetical protein
MADSAQVFKLNDPLHSPQYNFGRHHAIGKWRLRGLLCLVVGRDGTDSGCVLRSCSKKVMTPQQICGTAVCGEKRPKKNAVFAWVTQGPHWNRVVVRRWNLLLFRCAPSGYS